MSNNPIEDVKKAMSVSPDRIAVILRARENKEEIWKKKPMVDCGVYPLFAEISDSGLVKYSEEPEKPFVPAKIVWEELRAQYHGLRLIFNYVGKDKSERSVLDNYDYDCISAFLINGVLTIEGKTKIIVGDGVSLEEAVGLLLRSPKHVNYTYVEDDLRNGGFN